MITKGIRVRINTDTALNGLTGYIDRTDTSRLPYHVTFDKGQTVVEGAWFKEQELQVIGESQKEETGQ